MLLSRIADSLYWMSRYLERVDSTARLVEINLIHLLEADRAVSEAAEWKPLLAICSTEAVYAKAFGTSEVTSSRVIQFLLRERANPGSARQSLRLARENARAVRDRISREMWECVNDLYLRHQERLARPLAPERAADHCRFLRSEVARFHGHTSSTMMRGEAFGFYLLGFFLERADMTARIMDVKYHLLLPDLSLVGSALDYYQWAALLKSMSGFEAYRRRYASLLPAERRGVRDPRRGLPALAPLRRRPHGPGARVDRLGARGLALGSGDRGAGRPPRRPHRKLALRGGAPRVPGDVPRRRVEAARRAPARVLRSPSRERGRLRYLIEHESRLRFPEPVREHHFELRLAPQSGEALRVLRCDVTVAPETELREHVDSFGNRVVRGSLMAPHESLDARVNALVETRLENPFAFTALAPPAERAWLARELSADPSLHSFLLHRSPAVPELAALEGLEAPAWDESRTLLENAVAALDWCKDRFEYEPGGTLVHGPLDTFVKRGGGVCQDFAHLVVALVRGWGFPARYVAGYVDPGPDEPPDRVDARVGGAARARRGVARRRRHVRARRERSLRARRRRPRLPRRRARARHLQGRSAAGDSRGPPARPASGGTAVSGRALEVRREAFFRLELPYREGLSLERTVFRGGDGPRVCIVSGIHGDELEGLYVCHRLARRGSRRSRAGAPARSRGSIELYPALNPLGLDTLQRRVPIYDVDLNRELPGPRPGLLPQRLAARRDARRCSAPRWSSTSTRATSTCARSRRCGSRARSRPSSCRSRGA